MSANLIEEVAEREANRIRKEWGSLDSSGIPGIWRQVAPIVADVLDILTRDGRLPTTTHPTASAGLAGTEGERRE